ncbi:hypothetical protein [Tenacibaculum piscium]|uniref:hypothetical protein n=1 Tax=Tenacibaculum piscium TaxID=1458515 RepID=UPI0023B95A74|nr:hypothetical protein [Tenacibaculum piscium]
MKLKIELQNPIPIKAHLSAFNEMYEKNFEVCIVKDLLENGKRTLVIDFVGDDKIRDIYFFGYLARKKQEDSLS